MCYNSAFSHKDSCIIDFWLLFFPAAIPLKSELAYEVLEKGEVRFWIQAESLSPNSTFRFVINDKEVENSDVSTYWVLYIYMWFCLIKLYALTSIQYL